MVTQCKGMNRDGKPCSAHVYAGDEFCRWHDPARESDRVEWRRKGGANKSNKARARKQLAEQLMTIDDIDALLCSALVKVAAGRIDPGVGSAMAGISKTIVGIRATGDFERRLEELERAAGVSTIRRFTG